MFSGEHAVRRTQPKSTLRWLSKGSFGGGDSSQLSMAEWRQQLVFGFVRFSDVRGRVPGSSFPAPSQEAAACGPSYFFGRFAVRLVGARVVDVDLSLESCFEEGATAFGFTCLSAWIN